jgi:hypothetical protein
VLSNLSNESVADDGDVCDSSTADCRQSEIDDWSVMQR